MNKEYFIHSLRPVLPAHNLLQDEIVDWTIKSHMRSERMLGSEPDEKFEHTLRRFTLNSNHISKRYFECGEVDNEWSNHDIYNIDRDNPHGATLEIRNKFFAEKAKKVFHELYQNHAPAHVIHVTCTGYVSPSPVQSFFSSKDSNTAVTHAYHMGCYASLPAIRMGLGLSMSEGADIDIVHTEMCSLHLNPGIHTPEQMVVQTLFADGHIKYSVGPHGSGMKILCIKEKLIPDTLNDMTWVPSSHGMSMTLSREVPFRIRDSLPGFVSELCRQGGVRLEDVLRKGIFAIHPGGPKIIEAVQKKLEISDEQVAHSKNVLFERGNMSSATLPHVWTEIMKSGPADGTIVLSLAFGPGLTIFGSLFEVRR